jgi:hypothetical protein
MKEKADHEGGLMKKLPPKKRTVRKSPQGKSQTTEQARKQKATRKPILKSYEPPDLPLTKLNTKREVLLLIAEGGLAIVHDLFDCCFKVFLRLTSYHPASIVVDEQFTAAELFTIESVNTAKMQIENHIELATIWGNAPDEEVLRDLQRRYQDACALYEGLLTWGKNWNLEKDWIYQFGHYVLMDYWQKNHKPARALPPPASPRSRLVDAAERALAAPLDRLVEPAVEASPPSPPPPRAVVPKLLTALQGSKEAKTAPALFEMPNRVPEINTDRIIASWRSAVWALVREAEGQMTAPEEKWENIFTQHSWGGSFLRTRRSEYIQPEQRKIQAPKPPERFPPVADWEPGRNHVVTRGRYESKVKVKIWVDLEYSLAEYTPEQVRKRWAAQIFKNCKPELDRYWKEYCEHLKKHGWVEVIEKKDLRRHCKWFLRHVVEGKTQGEIAIGNEGKGGKTNISQRIAKIAKWLDMDSVKRGGKGKLKFTWKR